MQLKKGGSMDKKDVFVVAVGLLAIVFISSWVVYGTIAIANQSAIASNGVNTVLLQQRDLLIKKLMKQNSAKQEEINLAKKDVDSAKQAVNTAKAELAASNDKLDTIKKVVQ
jgi:capsule polysaccharide export protein KpsE/RkpR